jgi:phosphohistidine swiveling domain-containing protein
MDILGQMGESCVIGTKNATRVFHDGNLVQVDANKGIFRKEKEKSKK